jgi:hypothetical protein
MMAVATGPSSLSAKVVRATLVMLVTALAAFLLGTGSAHAAYGEYKVLMAEVYEEGPHRLGGQLAAFPGIKEIDYVDTSEVTPTAAELAKYDLVVSVGDNSYLNSEAWGDALAGYVDGGGVVVQTAYDTWEDVGALGRFETGGYEPLLPGDNVNDEVELGTFDTASPLMQGVGKLMSWDNTESEAAPGATVVAKWTNGANAIAVKGRVVAISGFLGDDYGEEEIWDGNYGQILFNVLRTLGPQPPPVVIATPPAPPAPLPPPSNAIKLGKLKRDEKSGTARLTVNLPGSGSLVMTGKGVKKATVTSAAAATVTVLVKAVGKAKKKLLETGKVKLTAKLSFTPTGGTAGLRKRKLILKKALE